MTMTAASQKHGQAAWLCELVSSTLVDLATVKGRDLGDLNNLKKFHLQQNSLQRYQSSNLKRIEHLTPLHKFQLRLDFRI